VRGPPPPRRGRFGGDSRGAATHGRCAPELQGLRRCNAAPFDPRKQQDAAVVACGAAGEGTFRGARLPRCACSSPPVAGQRPCPWAPRHLSCLRRCVDMCT
jgi:hypothetical protein